MKKGIISLVLGLVFAVVGVVSFAPVTDAQITDRNKPPSASSQITDVQKYSGLRGGTLPVFIATVIRWLLGLIGVVLVAMFVYGGVMYATSAGNDERVQTGKNIMIYAVIGTTIIVIAFIASDYIITTLLAPAQTGSQL